MTEVSLAELLDELDGKVRTELASTPSVEIKDDALDTSDLPIAARKWHKATDVVAVFADLKNSSQLGVGIHASSTASVYEAAVGGLVKVLDQFDANYIDIQGDAAFGVFWGERKYERAMCAGITIKTFSVDMTGRLEKKWPAQPETGFRVGVASSAVLVKRIGTPRNLAQQKPVWAGKTVNYASKAASAGDRHQLVVTGSVWDRIEKNDYLTLSCACSSPSPDLWQNITIPRLREGDESEAAGRLLTQQWCKVHGPEYCTAVLAGQTKRPEVNSQLRSAVLNTQLGEMFRLNAHKARELKRLQLRGLRGK